MLQKNPKGQIFCLVTNLNSNKKGNDCQKIPNLQYAATLGQMFDFFLFPLMITPFTYQVLFLTP